jgi:hypothetical protein
MFIRGRERDDFLAIAVVFCRPDTYRHARIVADGIIGLSTVDATMFDRRRGIALRHALAAYVECDRRAQVGHAHLYQGHIRYELSEEALQPNMSIYLHRSYASLKNHGIYLNRAIV